MRGFLILAVFFAMFAVASLLIPCPMFPGSLFCVWVGLAVGGYGVYLSALFNGIFYGGVLWLTFVIINRRLEEET